MAKEIIMKQGKLGVFSGIKKSAGLVLLLVIVVGIFMFLVNLITH